MIVRTLAGIAAAIARSAFAGWAAFALGAMPGCAGRTPMAAPLPPAAPAAQRANPASQYCAARGGTVAIEKNGAGAEYGVCGFADNRQCEEWAMLRGDCPVGGIRVAGYVTPAARYCALTGGRYAVTGTTNAPDEQGACSFQDGRRCDARAYYDGRCGR